LRELEVEHDDFRLRLEDPGDRFTHPRGVPHDLHAWNRIQQPGQALQHRGRIFYEENIHAAVCRRHFSRPIGGG